MDFKFKTSGHNWEIAPNIQDLQHNGYPDVKEQITTNFLKPADHWDYGRNIPNRFDEVKAEKWNENGKIKIIPIKFKGHDEIQYGVYLIPNIPMEIKVLSKVIYPWDGKMGKSKAKAAGRDNREYTFEAITTIQIEKGEAVPLGMTTNYGKARNNFGSHWAHLYKVHFPKSHYPETSNGLEKIYHYDTKSDLEFNANSAVTVKEWNSGNIIKTTTLAGLLGKEKIFDVGFLVEGKVRQHQGLRQL